MSHADGCYTTTHYQQFTTAFIPSRAPFGTQLSYCGSSDCDPWHAQPVVYVTITPVVVCHIPAAVGVP